MITAHHVATHGDVLSALCPILPVIAVVLLLLGLLGLVARRPPMPDPVGCMIGALITFIVWAIVC